jgi:hypothetical protein
MAQQPLMGQTLLIGFATTFRQTTLVGLLWTNDEPDEEPPTWRHPQETDIHAPPPPGEIRTHSASKRAVAELRLRPGNHRNRLPITRIMKLFTSNLN